MFFFSGCYGHNCSGQIDSFGGNAGEGRLLDENTWETGPVNGPFLPFPRQQVYLLDLQELGTDRTPDKIMPYISAERDPLAEGGNYTLAAGNLVEISNSDRGKLTVRNGTCADYYIRVVVEAAPRASSDNHN